MAKKIIALLLVAMMLVALLPMAVLADTAVAEIVGGAQYETLEAAVGAAQDGETVKVLADCTFGYFAVKDKSITLDLNGCTISAKNGGAAIGLEGNATLTAADNSEAETGTVNGKPLAFWIEGEGNTLNVTGGTYIDAGSNMGVVNCNGYNSNTVIISGGTLKSTEGSTPAVQLVGSDNKLSITGGTLDAKTALTIYGSNETEISGGSFVNTTTLVKITGAEGTGNTVEISGGSFPGTITTFASVTSGAGTVEVKGGTFGTEVPEEFCAPGYKPVYDPNTGTYSVEEPEPVAKIGSTNYFSVADAFKALKENETLEILVADTYTMPSLPAGVTVKGAVDGVQIDARAGVNNSSGSTFENITFLFGNSEGFYGEGGYLTGFSFHTDVTFNDCTFKGQVYTNAKTFICNNCTFENRGKGYPLYVYGSALVELNECVFDVDGKAVKIAKDGDPSPVTVIADNCTFNSISVNKPAIMYDTRYSQITVIVNESTFNENFTSKDCEGGTGLPFWDEYYVAGTEKFPSATAIGKDIVLDENNKLIGGTLTVLEATTVDGNDGVDALIPVGYEITENDNGTFGVQPLPEGVPADAVKVADGFYQNGATYTASTEFYITNEEGLLYFGRLVNGEAPTLYPAALKGPANYTSQYMSGKTVRLVADVDLTGVDWEPIGNPKNPDGTARVDKTLFYGTFDGGIYDADGVLIGKHVISNLECLRSSISGNKTYYVGLFGYVTSSGTAIKNLTLNNVNLLGYNNVGAVVGNAKTGTLLIENIDVTGNISIKGTYPYAACVGGIAGISSGTIRNCTISGTGTIQTDGTDSAGIVGQKNGGSVSGCEVKDTVVVSAEKGISAAIVGNVSAAGVQVINNVSTGKQVSKFQADTLIGKDVAFDESGKVVGGTFENVPADAVGTGFSAYKQEDGTYAVEKTRVAQIGTAYFTSINEALAAAEAASEDVVITILCDVTEKIAKRYDFGSCNVTITAENPVVIDFDDLGDTSKGLAVTNGKLLTIGANVTVKGVNFVGLRHANGGSVDVYGKLYLGFLRGTNDNVDVKSTLYIHEGGEVYEMYTGTCQFVVEGNTDLTVEGTKDSHSPIRIETRGDKNITFKDATFDAGSVWASYGDYDPDGAKINFTLDNSTLTAGTQFNINTAAEDFESVLTLKNGSTLNLTTNCVAAFRASDVINIDLTSKIVVNGTNATFNNAGKIVVDMTGATADSYTIVDYAGKDTMTLADYGTVEVTGAYAAKVVDNDLVIVKAVAKIGNVYFATFADAAAAAQVGDVVEILVEEVDLTGMKNGLTVVGLVDESGAPATTVTKIDNNYKDATLKNLVFATTQNGSKQIYGANFDNTLFENCKFTGNNGLRFCYAKGDVTFKSCAFDTKTYGAHFDGGNGNVTFDGCKISGFNTFYKSLASLTFTDCEFTKTANNPYCVCQTHGTMDIVGKTTFSEEWATPNDYTYVGTALPTAVVTIGKDVTVENGTVLGMLGEQDGVAAVAVEKDESGKYTSGEFVGTLESVQALAADDKAAVYDKAKGCYVLVDAAASVDGIRYATLAEAVSAAIEGNFEITVISGDIDAFLSGTNYKAELVDGNVYNIVPVTEGGKCEYTVNKELVDGLVCDVTIGGVSLGKFTFEKSGDGWNIKKDNGKYVSFDGSKVTESTVPYTWKYDNGTFFTTVTTTETVEEETNFFMRIINLILRLFGLGGDSTTREVTTTYYLGVSGDQLAAVSSAAKVSLTKQVVADEHAYGDCQDLGNGYHAQVCANCGLTSIPEAHSFSEGSCTDCGAAESTEPVDPPVDDLTVSVVWTPKYDGWWIFQVVEHYTCTINVPGASAVYYRHIDDSLWSRYTGGFISELSHSLYIRVVDAGGVSHYYYYNVLTDTVSAISAATAG